MKNELTITDRHRKILAAASSFGHPAGMYHKECQELLVAGYIKPKTKLGWQHTSRYQITEEGRAAA